MNNFWHFGDSFAYNNFMLENQGCQIDNFGILLANKMNLNYEFHAITGLSNDLIFNKILEKNNEYKKGDVIFINWSFFTRNSFVDIPDYNHPNWINGDMYEPIKSTNEWFNDDEKRYMKEESNFDSFIEKHQFIMEYTLNYNFDWTTKLFNTIQKYFKTLLDKGVVIYNLFIKENELLYYGESNCNFTFLDDMGINIKFNPSYSEWLYNNGYHGEDEGHYSSNVQTILCEEIYKKIQNSKINGLI